MKPQHFALILSALAAAINVRAESIPQGTLLDCRVRTLVFNENQVYRITAYYGYETDVELADNEEIRTVAAGDTVGWQIVSAGQHLFIKPMAQNARTNVSVITNRRTYLFELVAESPSNRSDMTYLVRFKYPQTNVVLSTRTGEKGDPAAFNFNYKIKGDKSVRPTRVFDDGLFTFFQFDNARNRDLPAIFWVSPDGRENLVNYRMEGNYVVVERTGEKFVLRSGDEKANVQNKLRNDQITDAPPNDNPVNDR
jgi:type IV secretion system protein VirB9